MNWEARILAAEKRFKAKQKPFTPEDIELAQLWTTCPLSECHDGIVLRHGELKYGPMDLYLVLDSIYFTKGVEEQDFGLAANCYKAIREQVVALRNGTDRTTQLNRFLNFKP